MKLFNDTNYNEVPVYATRLIYTSFARKQVSTIHDSAFLFVREKQTLSSSNNFFSVIDKTFFKLLLKFSDF